MLEEEESVNPTRRETLALGAAASIAAVVPVTAISAVDSDDVNALIDEFTGGAFVADGGVTIDAASLAENGNAVPVSVSAEGARVILLIANGNPNPGVAKFRFGRLSASPMASTRIRLARSQDLIAIAELQDGRFVKARHPIEVTVGGCG